METFKKVFIHSESDLPKDGWYIAHYKGYDLNSPAGTIISIYDHLSEFKKHNWLTHIDWYLQPIEQSDNTAIKIEKLIEVLKLDFDGDTSYHSGVNDGMYSLYRKLKEIKVL